MKKKPHFTGTGGKNMINEKKRRADGADNTDEKGAAANAGSANAETKNAEAANAGAAATNTGAGAANAGSVNTAVTNAGAVNTAATNAESVNTATTNAESVFGSDTEGANANGASANGVAARHSEDATTPCTTTPDKAEPSRAPAETAAEIAALEKKLADAEAQSAEYLDRWKRNAAEFENYKRRTQNEMERIYTASAADVIACFLPIADSIERAVGPSAGKADKNIGTTGDGGMAGGSQNAGDGGATGASANAGTDGTDPYTDPYKEGLALIERQIQDTLRKLNVKPLPGVGEQFDPKLHEAIMHITDEALGQNVVAEVFQQGYVYKEKVVRHSVVKVAN